MKAPPLSERCPERMPIFQGASRWVLVNAAEACVNRDNRSGQIIADVIIFLFTESAGIRA